eukprot:Clim_evm36s155 gene=Clim_evmTU36s155
MSTPAARRLVQMSRTRVDGVRQFDPWTQKLQQVRIYFNSLNGGSRGVVEFLNEHMKQYARQNPMVSFVLHDKPGETARAVGVYEFNRRIPIPLHMKTAEEVREKLENLRNRSGAQRVRHTKHQTSSRPSIQGVWNVFQDY